MPPDQVNLCHVEAKKLHEHEAQQLIYEAVQEDVALTN